MTGERFVVLGLASPRSGWFRELATWATAAAVPVDFIKCLSIDEVHTRLAGGRPYSALLIGADVLGLDRDLVDAAATAGTGVIVVDPTPGRDWLALGVRGFLTEPFDRADLMANLAEHASPISPVAPEPPDPTSAGDEPTRRGRLVAVTGPGGSGTSTLAMGLAQTLAAADPSPVLLADLARNGELAMLHDAREIVPGLLELVDAHRLARPTPADTHAMTFDAVGRGYQVLLGLRRPRDWTAIRPRAFEAALGSLTATYEWVVADVDADVEGAADTGSSDVEDRNRVARTTLSRADVVVVTSPAGLKGLHALGRTIRDLVGVAVPIERILPVFTRAPRMRRSRTQLAKSLAALLGPGQGFEDLPGPVFVGDRRDIEAAFRDGVRLPDSLSRQSHRHVIEIIEQVGPRAAPVGVEPLAVVPGTLGSWAAEEAS